MSGVDVTCCLISLIKSFSFIGLSTIPFTGGLFPLLNLTSVTWARVLSTPYMMMMVLLMFMAMVILWNSPGLVR